MGKKNKKKKGNQGGIMLKAQKDQNRLLEANEWYKAVFEKADVKEGDYGDYVIMEFKLSNGYFEDGEMSAKGWKCSALLGMRLEPKQPLWDFAKVFTKGKLEIDDDIDLTAYYGKKYRVFIENIQKGDNIRSRITKIKADKKKK